MDLEVIQTWRVLKLLDYLKDNINDYSYNQLKTFLDQSIKYIKDNSFTAYE